MNQLVLIFHLWNARNKARKVAEIEARNLLRGLNPEVLRGGPLSEQKGVFWVAIPENFLSQVPKRLHKLGYTRAVDFAQFVPDDSLPSNCQELITKNELVRWRKQYYKIVRLHETSKHTILNRSPDRREFMLKLSDGVIQLVRGYRGDGYALSRRGLPPYDARMIVNLVTPPTELAKLLDPFAGVGGVVIEAIENGFQVFSSDIDPFLMHGLEHLGATHCVSDARCLPFGNGTIDAIATEPPYDKSTEKLLEDSLKEMVRVLKIGARLAIFAAAWQADLLRSVGLSIKLVPFLEAKVNRKGTDCFVIAWEKVC
jgi:adenine-specific DNA methylase